MLLTTLPDIGRPLEFKMADSRPEVEITFERNAIATRFQSLPHIFGHARYARVTETLPDIGRSAEFKMADSRPEIEITFERNAVATRFQRVPQIFDHAQPACITADIAQHRPTTGIQNGGLKTGSTLYLRIRRPTSGSVPSVTIE